MKCTLCHFLRDRRGVCDALKALLVCDRCGDAYGSRLIWCPKCAGHRSVQVAGRLLRDAGREYMQSPLCPLSTGEKRSLADRQSGGSLQGVLF